MKVIIYEYKKMLRAGKLLDSLKVSGSSNFRVLAELADILDSGKSGEYEEKKDGIRDGMEREKIQQDKLEE